MFEGRKVIEYLYNHFKKNPKKQKTQTHSVLGEGCFSPVADEPGIALIDVDNSLWVHVKADEDSSQQVTSCWTQRAHHIHNGWGDGGHGGENSVKTSNLWPQRGNKTPKTSINSNQMWGEILTLLMKTLNQLKSTIKRPSSPGGLSVLANHLTGLVETEWEWRQGIVLALWWWAVVLIVKMYSVISHKTKGFAVLSSYPAGLGHAAAFPVHVNHWLCVSWLVPDWLSWRRGVHFYLFMFRIIEPPNNCQLEPLDWLPDPPPE